MIFRILRIEKSDIDGLSKVYVHKDGKRYYYYPTKHAIKGDEFQGKKYFLFVVLAIIANAKNEIVERKKTK